MVAMVDQNFHIGNCIKKVSMALRAKGSVAQHQYQTSSSSINTSTSSTTSSSINNSTSNTTSSSINTSTSNTTSSSSINTSTSKTTSSSSINTSTTNTTSSSSINTTLVLATPLVAAATLAPATPLVAPATPLVASTRTKTTPAAAPPVQAAQAPFTWIIIVTTITAQPPHKHDSLTPLPLWDPKLPSLPTQTRGFPQSSH
ncbi:hypothetical protein FHG87_013162 [Trinorchestia longiramus]|nr:hypothetical protein FHG87_013162 [Trinorchestia longiramus]